MLFVERRSGRTAHRGELLVPRLEIGFLDPASTPDALAVFAPWTRARLPGDGAMAKLVELVEGCTVEPVHTTVSQAKPEPISSVAIDRPYKGVGQPVSCGEVFEPLTVVPPYPAVARAEPHIAGRVLGDGKYAT